MAPVTRKRKASAEQSDTGQSKAPAKNTRRTAAPKKVGTKQKQLAGEYTMDEGRNNSRAFFRASKRHRVGTNHAKEQIVKRVNEVLASLESENTMSKLHAEPSLRKCLLAKSSTIIPWAESKQSAVNAAVQLENPFDRSQKLLACLNASLIKYEGINSRNLGLKKPSWMRWAEDKKDLETINEYAMGIAARTINRMIVPRRNSALPTLSSKAGDLERMAWEMMEESLPRRDEETWGDMARGCIKAFAGILKPNDGEPKVQ